MKNTERLAWTLRLLFFPTGRIHLHLPVKGKDRDGSLREFSFDLHDKTLNEIEVYLADRFKGATFEIWRRSRSGGIWQGEKEKNLVFYIDLRLRVRDLEWFFEMRNDAWRKRFNQELIYLAIHPIWF